MLQIILMVIAVFCLVLGVISTITNIVSCRNVSLWPQIILITAGLSYLIWFCN